METRLLATLATLAVAASLAFAARSRDPPAPPAQPGTSWTCATASGYCTTVPAPQLAPCSCADLLHGLLPGRVTSRALPLRLLPSRPAAAGLDPDETSLLAP